MDLGLSFWDQVAQNAQRTKNDVCVVLAKNKRKPVVPAAPIVGIKVFAKPAPIWIETIATSRSKIADVMSVGPYGFKTRVAVKHAMKLFKAPALSTSLPQRSS